jgi:hypothetical protein
VDEPKGKVHQPSSRLITVPHQDRFPNGL